MAAIFCTFLLLLPKISFATPTYNGCGSSEADCKNDVSQIKEDSEISNQIKNTKGAERLDRVVDDWLGNLYGSDRKLSNDRTWRFNRKGLVPILIGIALKGLALIPLTLTGLMIIGSIAMFVSKVSLAISAAMFIRRFFSPDTTAGGFFGLNPLGFPHGGQQEHGHGKVKSYQPVHRRSDQMEILRNLRDFGANMKLRNQVES